MELKYAEGDRKSHIYFLSMIVFYLDGLRNMRDRRDNVLIMTIGGYQIIWGFKILLILSIIRDCLTWWGEIKGELFKD
ncbi:hypothetical protein EPI10_028566 [Gossypium australe]|uniref:Transmembrane protein n=1 Tax=Gossypium australe TaxID=47621 RepID=A0A5B6UVF2_9ROSI|nr:hypothetical protein EPI10_028566 [Gossypium australe]